jgi:hypothetical protein
LAARLLTPFTSTVPQISTPPAVSICASATFFIGTISPAAFVGG